MTPPAARPAEALAALAEGLRLLARRPTSAALLLGATLAQGAVQGAVIWTIRHVLGVFSRDGLATGWGGIALGAGAVYALWLLRAGSGAAAEVLAARLSHEAEMDAMEHTLAKLLGLGPAHFDRHSAGEIVMSAHADLKSVRVAVLDAAALLLHGSRLLGLAVVAWLMSPTLAVLGLVFVPVALLPAHRIGRRITDAADRERQTVTGLVDRFLEVAAGYRVLAVNRGGAQVLAAARRAGRRLRHAVHRQARGKAAARLLFESVSGAGLVLVLGVGGWQVAAGGLAWESLLSLLIAVIATYAPLLGLLQVYASVHTALPGLRRRRALLALPPTVPEPAHPRRLVAPPRTITLDRVSFDYGGDEGPPALHDVSLTVQAGETVGIVGPSGAGKSTLLALLLRFYDPARGVVRLDGVDLREIARDDYMALCAMVPQEPFLFFDSIARNIEAARPGATRAEIEAAARAAGIHDEIVAMPDGYDAVIGRGGAARGISVGQKQRIAIAAALLKNAPFLFLDEATSSLDSLSERLVQEALQRLMAGRTTFVVAHRLSTLRAADRLLVLDGGRLVATGTHEALLAGCDTYQRLWRSQRLAGSADGVGDAAAAGAVAWPARAVRPAAAEAAG